MKIVGVFNKRLESFCYAVNDIRPLHIASSVATCIHNLNYAVENNELEFKKEMLAELKELYAEGKAKFNLSMSDINWFVWYECMSSATRSKHSILNNNGKRNYRY